MVSATPYRYTTRGFLHQSPGAYGGSGTGVPTLQALPARSPAPYSRARVRVARSRRSPHKARPRGVRVRIVDGDVHVRRTGRGTPRASIARPAHHDRVVAVCGDRAECEAERLGQPGDGGASVTVAHEQLRLVMNAGEAATRAQGMNGEARASSTARRSRSGRPTSLGGKPTSRRNASPGGVRSRCSPSVKRRFPELVTLFWRPAAKGAAHGGRAGGGSGAADAVAGPEDEHERAANDAHLTTHKTDPRIATARRPVHVGPQVVRQPPGEGGQPVARRRSLTARRGRSRRGRCPAARSRAPAVHARCPRSCAGCRRCRSRAPTPCPSSAPARSAGRNRAR